ncbi:MAG: hypothetical protein R3E68_23505, partial [Burkholderiaceae bacterium]
MITGHRHRYSLPAVLCLALVLPSFAARSVSADSAPAPSVETPVLTLSEAVAIAQHRSGELDALRASQR